MAFGLFKKKKKVEKKEVPKKEEAKKPVEQKVEKKKNVAVKTDDAIAYGVIRFQHITEKATALASLNKYVFKVFKTANKMSVTHAVEKLYKVKVESVNMMNVPTKTVKLGRFEGTRGGYKKAIVTLRQGDKIEVAPH